MTTAPEQSWQGEIWLGDDHCLLLGAVARTTSHAHYAHQVLVGLDGPVEVSLGAHTQRGALLAIPSRQPHAILSQGARCLTLFAEPLAFELDDLAEACRLAGNEPTRLARYLHDCPRRPLPPRLACALQRLRALDDQKLPAHELAAAAALSISQLERLFSGTLKLSVRRMVLWQRLRTGLQLALGGASLTDAALAAGFADAAHFSRSVRQQFGLSPSSGLRHLRLGTLGQCPA